MTLTPTPLTGDIQVNTFTTFEQVHSSVAALREGGFVIIWSSSVQDGSGNGIYGQRYDAGGTPVGGEFQVNTFTEHNQLSPSVAAVEGGGFVVTWLTADPYFRNINGQRYDANGNPIGTEFAVSVGEKIAQHHPSVAALEHGGFITTWQSGSRDGSGWGVYGQRFDAGGNPTGAEFRVNTETTNDQSFPSLTALDGGGFVIIWSSLDQDEPGNFNWGVYGQRYDAGGTPVGVEFQVNTSTSDTQLYSSVAKLDGGGFVVTWSSNNQDGDRSGIYGQRYDAGGSPVGAEFQVNTETISDQNYSSVAALDDGGFVVTWSSSGQDGSLRGIYGQRFDAAGNPVGTEFRLNDVTAGEQLHVSYGAGEATAVLANGTLVSTWSGDGTEEVFVRLFEVPGADLSLVGTDLADTLDGFGGDDTIKARAGDDDINSGAGDDFIVAGAGNDTVDAGGGNDTIIAGDGADSLTGGAGSDQFRFGANDGANTITDFVIGEDLLNLKSAGVTALSELAQVDDGGDLVISLVGGTTSVRLEGLAGATLGVADFVDIIDDVSPPVRVFDGAAFVAAFATIQEAVDAAVAGNTIEVTAGTYAETVVVDKQLTILGANAGTPGSDAGRGPESTLVGGIQFAAGSDGAVIDGLNIQEGAAFTGATSAVHVQAANVEITNMLIEGPGSSSGAYGIFLDPAAADGPVVSHSQVSAFSTGADLNQGWTASLTDNVFRDNGFGVVVPGPDALDISGNVFVDNLSAHIAVSPRNDPANVNASVGSNSFFGAPGLAPAVFIEFGIVNGQTIIGTVNEDLFNASPSGQSLVGRAGDDVIKGGGGNDFLLGGTGNDVLDGGTGNDTLVGASGNDLMTGGDGADMFRFGADDGIDTIGDFVVGEDLLNFRSAGVSRLEEIQQIDDSGDLLLTVTGGTTSVRLIGLAGETLGTDDFLGVFAAATEGDDAITTGNVADETLDGLGGNDVLATGQGNDVLIGGAGNDFLLGAADNDTLEGGTGNDTLVGGTGDDVMTGGDDADLFRFGANDGSDVITDFAVGEDVINLRPAKITDFATEVTITEFGGDTTVEVGSTTITVQGVTGLQEQDFII